MKIVPAPGPGMPATFVPDPTPTPVDASPRYLRKGPREPSNTPEGCREKARLDLAQAATLSNCNARLKYEHSAASWTARADLLQQIDNNFEARRMRSKDAHSEPGQTS